MRILKKTSWFSLACLGIVACGGDFDSVSDLGGLDGGGYGSVDTGGFGDGTGGFGATQGGVQDIGLARELIAEGVVPPPSAFAVEGMFSEHDLGLEGEPCDDTLCLRGAIGVSDKAANQPAAWLQVGMSSNINAATLERPSQTFIMTVDVSGSMGLGRGEEAPGELARKLLLEIGEKLRPQDRVAVVTYGSSVTTTLPLTAGDNYQAYERVIDGLETNGSTNMEAGLRLAYRLAEDALDGETEQVRVMLFTDVRPNTGASTASEFDRLVKTGADLGVGLSVLAFGENLGQSVLRAMADVRGGNAFSVFSRDGADSLMEEHWPFMVMPLAYDLKIAFECDNVDIQHAYGFPSDNAAEIEVSSVFLSRKKGALLVQLGLEDYALSIPSFQTTGHLEYKNVGGELIEKEITLDYQDSLGNDYYEQQSVDRTVALALLTESLKRATELYLSDKTLSVSVVESALERFRSQISDVSNADLVREETMTSNLLELMQNDAEQRGEY